MLVVFEDQLRVPRVSRDPAVADMDLLAPVIRRLLVCFCVLAEVFHGLLVFLPDDRHSDVGILRSESRHLFI